MTALQIDSNYDQTPPPPFGHALLPYFLFDPNYLNLNHGSYGSLPRPVRSFCIEQGDEIESAPDLWMRLKYQAPLVKVREQVAAMIGVKDVDEVVIVPNASHGLNTVLRNIIWAAGDVIVVCNTTYNSIERTAQYLSDIGSHPSVSKFEISFPTSHAEILKNWTQHLKALNATLGEGKKIVAVVDGIISNPGCLLPWEKMVSICREEKVWSAVDAAHCIGQQVDINLDVIQPDYFVSNCHKWLFAKRGAAVLYVPKRNQHIVQNSFPTSHAYKSPKDRKEGENNFVAQYEWNGTIDFVPYLSVSAAIRFREWLGGEHAINEYNHKVAVEGAELLAKVLGTRNMDVTGECTLSMANVQLPIPEGYAYPEIDTMFKEKLLSSRNMFAAQYYHNDLWWVRVSAQVWVEVSDFETYGKALLEVCAEIVDEIKKSRPEV
ncbi:PLP-dependent transferase [Cylindrobasidium torrendii FP15055 ss-10]|uniref:PLP-dependent transferase n=1 Tax=Cylindrobasidium torrendii FP15055 ss-10 TaxID=1314674 RepID=A0A0D7BJ15_9AGAR|nr:PLP-dependent transferase [Cylindrobasidium torrendii FP15055 ss-10]